MRREAMTRRLVAALLFSGALLIQAAVPSIAHAAKPLSPQEEQANLKKADESLERISKKAPQVKQLLQELRGPQDHDRATKQLGMDALLLNPHFANQIETPLGQALYIPRQISERDAGRKSLYFIKAGEEVMTGIYVIGPTIYYRVVRRDTGEGIPAQTGDLYTDIITTQENEVVSETQGTLTVLDPARGIGTFEPTDKLAGSPEALENSIAWWGWSFYLG